MKTYLSKIFAFLLIGLVLGEIISRLFFLTSEIPQRMIDKNMIQRYIPNQSGYWKGGTHEWQINKFGWPGPEPENFDNLITIIGDSYIENFMNPDSCHQSVYLKSFLPKYNFLEAARSGVSLIEALEISKELDSLSPRLQLLYLADSDFEESLSNVQSRSNVTQLNLENEKLIYGNLKSPGLKKVLYNWKLLYYLFNRFPPKFWNKNRPKVKTVGDSNKESNNNHEDFVSLINYIKNNYHTENLIFVFKPKTNPFLISISQNSGFKTLELDNSKDNNWSFNFDNHWSCYGHQKASEQVYSELVNYLK